MSMDYLTSIFGMRSRTYYNAIDDIMGEAVVITAFVQVIAQFDDMLQKIGSQRQCVESLQRKADAISSIQHSHIFMIKTRT